MGDGGIIVISLTGDDDDHERISRIEEDLGKADILEVHTRAALAPDLLARISKLAATEDLKLRFRDVRGG